MDAAQRERYSRQILFPPIGENGQERLLAAHAVIGYDQPSAFVRNAAKAGAAWPGYGRDAFSLRTDSDLAQLALIRAGAGVGICQVALARRNDALVRLMPRTFSLKLDTWVTMHEDLRNSPRCRAAFDALVEGLSLYIGGPAAEAKIPRARPTTPE